MVPQKINEGAPGLLVLLLMLSILFSPRPAAEEKKPAGSSEHKPLFVEIEGDVRHPAVYRFPHQPSLQELVEAAGGPRVDNASSPELEGLLLPSGIRVVIRRQEKNLQVSQQEMSAFYKLTLAIPISLNQTSEEELTAIPGIGPALARAIVEKRAEQGGFKTLDEIARIPGVGQKLYGKISPYLVL